MLDRLRALALAFFLIVFAVPAFAGPFEDAVGKFANDDFSDTDEAIGAVAVVRQSAGLSHHQRAAGRPADGRCRQQEGLRQAARRQGDRCRDRRRGRQHSRQRQRRPPQQPPAPHGRGRARRPDAAVARSRQADRGRAVGVQVA